jgi:hypothetical protein
MLLLNCDKCGNMWLGRIALPTSCPKCHNTTFKNARFYEVATPPDTEPSIKRLYIQKSAVQLVSDTTREDGNK